MITHIALENFKCFRKLEVDPRLITVFVGPNGSGKSSVLQALVLLKQSVRRPQLITQGELIDLGTFVSLVRHQSNGSFSLGFDGSYPPLAMQGAITDRFGKEVEFSLTSDFRQGQVISQWGRMAFDFNGAKFKLNANRSGKLDVSSIGIPGGDLKLSIKNDVGELLRATSYPSGREGYFDGFNNIFSVPTRLLTELRFVPAARGIVLPTHDLGKDMADDIPLGRGLSVQEEQTATNLGYGREHESKVSNWIQEVTKVGLLGEVVPDNKVHVLALAPVGRVNIVNEGFGTNALIQLFMQLANAVDGSTVMIEEPEIHLHPRAQAELASLLAEVAKAEDKQLIMTTHSEHILGRLLTLVAEKKLSPDELAIYAFEKDDDGVCTASELEVTEDGRVKGGIKDFFESDLAEVNRYIKALQPSQ